MNYKSTRNNEKTVKSSYAVLHGLAGDGGLYIPDALPSVNLDYEILKDMSYQETALYVLKEFFPDLGEEELKTSINNAYSSTTFNTPEIAPVVNLNQGVSLTELFHGRTLAFKDLALSLFPYLLTASKKVENEQKDILILTATSGDTGKAALEGFRDIEGIKIIVFYPKNGVSPMQEDQMRKQLGNNVDIVAIEGNFDDAQSAVKNIFSSDDFKKLCQENNMTFSSANSINIGRLFPQIVYYVTTYVNLRNKGIIKEGEKFNVVVPTGNFGNILAGFIAKKLGIPINRFISASNENNVLSDFFNTGTYNKERPFYTTNSPSMDILLSSNFERYLYYVTGENSGRLSELMDNLTKNNTLSVTKEELAEIQKEFCGDFATEAETVASIKKVYSESAYLMDPHTAVGYAVLEKYLEKSGDKTHSVVISTAHPYKFPYAAAQALDMTEKENPYEMLDDLSAVTGIKLPKQLTELKTLPLRFSVIIDKSEISEYVKDKITGKK
ncbi:threonine synthase [Sebaldella sp. S0638]|uniref:threonine synthase n=1 Tax=Sebaldella sp. S0638 TaxID=2957809 RepID=UPI00209E5624|nr:threonine synthase [Sebaldella sp. S0638]MCP1224049.1 threonine synthase [Sebaldella sp. S0638]